MWRVMQLLVTLALVPLMVLMQLVPALFQIFVWVTYMVFLTGGRLLARPLDAGPIVLLSGLLWGALALLALPWLSIVLVPNIALLVLGAIGVIWGLCIGGQVAWRWQVDRLRVPDLDPYRQFGLPAHLFGHPQLHPKTRSLDEMMADGIILGETEEDIR